MEEWFEKAKHIEIKNLSNFITEILEKIPRTYDNDCHIVTIAAIAAAYAISKELSITGFQASCIMWEFIQNWTKKNNKTGLKLIDYDDMLYPQYKYKFEKVISKETWEALQLEATKRLLEENHVCNEVKEHWKNIIKGIVPFGYKICR